MFMIVSLDLSNDRILITVVLTRRSSLSVADYICCVEEITLTGCEQATVINQNKRSAMHLCLYSVFLFKGHHVKIADQFLVTTQT